MRREMMIDLDLLMESMSNVISAKDKINSEVEFLINEERRLNNITNDLLHKLELLELDDNEVTNIAYELQYCKRQRRDVKEKLEKLEPFKKMFTSADISKAVNNMGNQIGVLRKKALNQNNRVYACREIDNGRMLFREYEDYELRVVPKIDKNKKIRRSIPRKRMEKF